MHPFSLWIWHFAAELVHDGYMRSYCGIYTEDDSYHDNNCRDYVLATPEELPTVLEYEGAHRVCDVCALLSLGNTND